MGISRKHASKKSPSQNPVDFYHCKEHGGTHGHPMEKVGDVLKSGAMKEKVMGRKNLSKQ